MPGLVRKLLICAGAQGLLLQPINSRSQPSNSLPLVVSYKDCTISPSLKQHDETKAGQGLESHGLIGIIKLASASYLISITHRKQVALVRGKPIYVVTDVSFIPLASQTEAQSSIDHARRVPKQGKESTLSDTDTDDETDEHTSTAGTEDGHDTLPPTPLGAPGTTDATKGLAPPMQGSTVAADVIKDRGKYGRFAERWFSRSGWTASGREKLGMSRSEDDLVREQRRQGLNTIPADTARQDEAKQAASTATSTSDAHKIQSSNSLTEDAPNTPQLSIADGIVQSLTPRILRTLRVFLSSESFYFSYDYDLSRRTAIQEASPSTLPLHKRFNPLYFWNHHLIMPFIESNQHSLVLPLIQGFVGQRGFSVEKTAKTETDKIVDTVQDPGEVFELKERNDVKTEGSVADTAADTTSNTKEADTHDFLLTLISRRSIKRAGLRYLRRGVDEGGNVANNVETEQILAEQPWEDSSKVFSLAQVRGSIPVFFSQSPYSLKPAAITYGSEATNHQAFNKHFRNLIEDYGQVQIASLVDKHGTEKVIGSLYEHHVEMTNEGKLPSHGFPGPKPSSTSKAFSPTRLSEQNLAYTWFDFHHECRAFNFQNVSYLLDCLSPALSGFGWTEQSQATGVTHIQSGVIRTNCMDCLDRTNVVQSAIAGHILQQQLATFELSIDLSTDPKTQWFNTLWADNGDAISRQYAGTAALKGDYTRTRKRTLPGAISDFSLTLGRYYNNIFSDYFLQTTIDFILGLGDESIWEDFETDLVTSDHALDMSRVRQAAVERSVTVVLGRDAENDEGDDENDDTAAPSRPRKTLGSRNTDESEDLISGWTLQTPSQPGTLRSLPLEECVLLLTDRALYAVRFDWATEKVGSYERVDLRDISSIRRGVYITSTLGAKNTAEDRNVGFVVEYRPRSGGAVRRVNTRSLSTAVKSSSSAESSTEGGTEEAKPEDTEEKDFAVAATASSADTSGKVLAFKALNPRATATANSSVAAMSERQVVELVTDEVARAAKARRIGDDEPGDEGKGSLEVKDEDVISLAEARKSTGYLETIGYSIRKLVWA